MQYQTLVQFLDEIGVAVSPARLKCLGKKVSTHCRLHGDELRDVPHPRWGSVKSYPRVALERCAGLQYFGDSVPHFSVTEGPRTPDCPEVAVAMLLSNIDGRSQAELYNLIYRRALGCGAGEYRSRARLGPGAVWKQLDPPLAGWFRQCLAWIADNHTLYAALRPCFEQATKVIPLPGEVHDPAPVPVDALSSEDLDLLARLYQDQPCSVDKLPYSRAMYDLARTFQAATGRAIPAGLIYRALLKRRKAGRLPLLRPRREGNDERIIGTISRTELAR